MHFLASPLLHLLHWVIASGRPGVVVPPLRHLVQFRRYQVENYLTRDQTPLPCEAIELEDTVVNGGDIKQRERQERKAACGP